MNRNQAQNIQFEEHPKIQRFKLLMSQLEGQCEEYLSQQNLDHILHHSLEKISIFLQENIINDTYESLTIEGYKVNKEDIKLIANWKSNTSTNNISSIIDIEWYIDSYNIFSDKINSYYGKLVKINKEYILDLNLTLFSYSPVAKKYIIPREYRSHNVWITGTKSPPSHLLVDLYMECFIDFINWLEVRNSKETIKKAVLTHFLFTFIHPFWDWNGRTGRLLMNYILSAHWYTPITIEANQRETYIEVLKQASENQDIVPFLKFILNKIT